jgi:hypothetical protein
MANYLEVRNMLLKHSSSFEASMSFTLQRLREQFYSCRVHPNNFQLDQ